MINNSGEKGFLLQSLRSWRDGDNDLLNDVTCLSSVIQALMPCFSHVNDSDKRAMLDAVSELLSANALPECDFLETMTNFVKERLTTGVPDDPLVALGRALMFAMTQDYSYLRDLYAFEQSIGFESPSVGKVMFVLGMEFSRGSHGARQFLEWLAQSPLTEEDFRQRVVDELNGVTPDTSWIWNFQG